MANSTKHRAHLTVRTSTALLARYMIYTLEGDLVLVLSTQATGHIRRSTSLEHGMPPEPPKLGLVLIRRVVKGFHRMADYYPNIR